MRLQQRSKTSSHSSLQACLLAASTAMTLLACSGSSGLAGLASAKSSDTSQNSGSSGNGSGAGSGSSGENDSANTPQQVSGAFLTCAYMAPAPAVKQLGETAPGSQNISLGCGVYQQPASSIVPANLKGLTLASSVVCPGAAPAPQPPLQSFPAGSALQFETMVSFNQIPACALRLGISDNLGRTALFDKSLDTLTQFDGAAGFDVNADVAATGLQFNPATQSWSVPPPVASAPTPVTTTAGTPTGATGTAPAANPALTSSEISAISSITGEGVGDIVKSNSSSDGGQVSGSGSGSGSSTSLTGNAPAKK